MTWAVKCPCTCFAFDAVQFEYAASGKRYTMFDEFVNDPTPTEYVPVLSVARKQKFVSKFVSCVYGNVKFVDVLSLVPEMLNQQVRVRPTNL